MTLSLTYELLAVVYALLGIPTECSFLRLVVRQARQCIRCSPLLHPINKSEENVTLRIVRNECQSRLTEVDRTDATLTVIHSWYLEESVERVEVRHLHGVIDKVVESFSVPRGDQLEEIFSM